MTTLINKEEIASHISQMNVVQAMESAFVQYSEGNVVVPPVGELLFENPKREVHLKYGYIKEDDFFCVKIAGGFYGNKDLGISTSQGLMLLFSQQTGETKAVLLDEGMLTDIRTAAAGALTARYFAPKRVKGIGIIGTGIQGQLQLQQVQAVRPCKQVWVWNRNLTGAEKYKETLGDEFNIHIAQSPEEVAQHTNLIFTTTPSETPLLSAHCIEPGTHITAVGSDTAEKQELQSDLVAKADLVIADSIAQSKSRGEIYRAAKDGLINPSDIIELGSAIKNPALQRTSEEQITMADLTGVAAQDILIAKMVYLAYLER